jgi:hypothetical protein
MISGHLSDPEVFMKSTLTILLIAATACLAQQRGNGDRVDSFPQFNERQLLVLTSAVTRQLPRNKTALLEPRA